MRGVVIGLVLVIGLGVAGYFALPVLIERQIEGLRAEVGDLKQRLAQVEGFVKGEEEARKTVRIEPGADTAAVIKGVNALSARMISQERTFRGEISKVDMAIKEQKSETATALRKLAEALGKESAEIRTQLREVTYKAVMAQIRGHLLKIKTDLLAKNIGTADAEMELTVGLLEKAKNAVSPEAIKSLEAAQATLRKARGEMDTDLPAAMKRVDLLWHELGKVKGNT